MTDRILPASPATLATEAAAVIQTERTGLDALVHALQDRTGWAARLPARWKFC